jgi:hypothetical protein
MANRVHVEGDHSSWQHEEAVRVADVTRHLAVLFAHAV